MWIKIKRTSQPDSLVNADNVATIAVAKQLTDPGTPDQFSLVIAFASVSKTLVVAMTNPPAPAPPKTLADLNNLRDGMWADLKAGNSTEVAGTDLPPLP